MSTHARFSIIPGWIVTDPRLKGRDLQVLCLLGRHTDKHGWCRRSQVKMAAQLNCARSTVQLSLDRLADIGAVEKHEQESADGRDSAHSYRVIYDREPPSGFGFDSDDGDDFEQNYSNKAQNEATHPADISAPPADPESAPPADLGSAPINVPYLTTPSERRGGAREREPVEEENSKTVQRKFNRWWPTYPGYEGTSRDAALKEWFAMTQAERDDCIARSPDFIKATKAAKGSFVYPSVYLRERKWQLLDNPRSDVAPPMVHNPFSRAWMAKWLAEQSKPMSTTGWPALTQFQQIQMRDADKARDIERERRSRYGWPRVTEMREKADRRAGVTVPGPLLALSDQFQKLHRDSDEAQAWRSLFDQMGRQWLPEPMPEWLYFPPGDPEQALSNFVNQFEAGGSGRANDDAA